jgi:WD40 repeat protein
MQRRPVAVCKRFEAAVVDAAFQQMSEVPGMIASGTELSRRARTAAAGAMGLLVLACGGSSDDGATSAAELSRETATALVAPRAAHSRLPRGRAWQGITAVDVAADGNIATAFSDGTVRLETANSQATLTRGAGTAATAVAFSADGKYLVSVGRDSVATVWSVATGARLLSLQGHEHAVRTVAVSADGAFIASAGEETRVLVWNAASGKLAKVLNGHSSFVNSVAFSADGKSVASGDAAGAVVLWNLASGAVRHRLAGHTDEVNSLSFSPDGRTLATAGEDRRVVLWNVDSGQRVQALDGHAAAVRTVAFSRDGRWLASGGEDAKVLVWDAATLALAKTLAGSATSVNALVFDGKRKQELVAADEGGRVVRWDVATGVSR